MPSLRHSLDELARMGDELYDREVLPLATEARRFGGVIRHPSLSSDA